MNHLVYLVCFLLVPPAVVSQNMTSAELKLLLAKEAAIVNEKENVVEYDLKGTTVLLFVDEPNDRMRFIAPIVQEKELDEKHKTLLLAANFDRALDVKYALYQEVLWSVFAHPLGSLQQKEVLSALYQVKSLVDTFGTTYSSTDIVFGEN